MGELLEVCKIVMQQFMKDIWNSCQPQILRQWGKIAGKEQGCIFSS